MSDIDFGTGPKLDSNYDFAIDMSGDIATNEPGTDTEELEKDLALNIATKLEEIGIGGKFTTEFKEDLRIEIGRVVKSDARILGIQQLDIENDPDDNNQLIIDIIVETEQGPFDLVIPV